MGDDGLGSRTCTIVPSPPSLTNPLSPRNRLCPVRTPQYRGLVSGGRYRGGLVWVGVWLRKIVCVVGRGVAFPVAADIAPARPRPAPPCAHTSPSSGV